MDGSGAQASPDVQALVSSLHERLVANGGWNKLLKQLRSGLEGSAWETDLSGYAREQATERGGDIHLNEMVELLQPQAKGERSPLVPEVIATPEGPLFP